MGKAVSDGEGKKEYDCTVKVVLPAVMFSSDTSAWLEAASRTIERLYVMSAPA